ncbi:putative ATP-grasp-modified RiPP [Nonomuraea sp. NPDC023979]|uniref:putative ATP-grasp-modified RiPP n=1 Tax=Nonomuraea sp. NPDC023979 TaxID=3154796 RepID=UPI0033C2A8A7
MATLLKPWGLTRATPQLPASAPPWAATQLDPDTQLTVFLDEHGNPIDITNGTSRTYVSVSMSKPTDGDGKGSEQADDSPNDQEKD